MDTQDKITVVKGKKEIIVLNYGEHPLFDIGRGRFVPHNFQAETYVSGYTLIASTLVDKSENKLKYRFALKDDSRIASGWKKSPTGALDEINRMLKNFRHKEGTNGQLMIGVTYEPVQARLRQVFNIKSSSKFSRAPSKEVAPAPALAPTPVPALPPLTTTTAITGPGYRGGKRVIPAHEDPETSSRSVKRNRSLNKSEKHTARRSHRHHDVEEVVDERSMQPLMFCVPEPGATPAKSRQRGDSQQTDAGYDELQFSSQQSLDIVGTEMRSQDTLHKYVEKILQQSSSQEDGGQLRWRDGTRLSYRGSQREDSLHSLKNDSTLLIEAMTKLARSDTQTDSVDAINKLVRSDTLTDSVVGDGGAPANESSQLSQFQWPSSQHSVILTSITGTASQQ